MLQYKGYTKKKYQVAGRTPLNKEFMEGVSSNLIETNMLPTHTTTAKRVIKNDISPTLFNDKWIPKTKEDELRKFSQPIINQSDNISNIKPKHLNQPSKPLLAYEPSNLVKRSKAALSTAQLANPSNLYLNAISAGGDIATALKYYYHGNTKKGNEDITQALTNFIPYKKGISGFKDGTYILSKFDKVFNKSLNSVRVGSDIKTIDESMNRKTGGKIKAQFGFKQLRNDNSNNDMGFSVADDRLKPHEVKDKSIYNAAKINTSHNSLPYTEIVKRIRELDNISGNPKISNKNSNVSTLLTSKPYGNSNVFRANYVPFTNTIHFPATLPNNLIDEYPHGYQKKEKGIMDMGKKTINSLIKNKGIYNNTYGDTNSVEFDAHQIIEPIMRSYVTEKYHSYDNIKDVKDIIKYRQKITDQYNNSTKNKNNNSFDKQDYLQDMRLTNPDLNDESENVYRNKGYWENELYRPTRVETVKQYAQDKIGGEPYSLNRNLNPRYKSLEVKKHGGKTNFKFNKQINNFKQK